MKLICLNTWGGRAGRENLLGFFDAHRDADFFCLQEIWSAPYAGLEGAPAGGAPLAHDAIMVTGKQEIGARLGGHAAFFHPHHLDDYGLMTLVSKRLDVVESGDVFVHRERGYVPEGDIGHHARNVQFVTVATARGRVGVMNFHGLWNGRGKGDSDDRLAQSRRLVAFLAGRREPFVLCGDFNLAPGTQSLRMLEAAGLRNLVAEFGVASTRTRLYRRPERFADYVFVSPGVDVRAFAVLPDEVSDHVPLRLEFDLS
ncbi:endonuclease/exonuclease/phosphatase family protein [Roseiarcus fermentans]|uniref:Endonuclease/exonuclease/phosphatase family protein n=1 Tax=Roseiarcus fermentans TaxID=1473586 RepID=A0A366EX14_9HYPH|nr:endonuclease/exonuclease/phosphatase family protein [Roseiarcus fermentans]RBP06240.1 endonuclease/exonuclease/phosphatase family protein [Roseiarcus fermentans]